MGFWIYMLISCLLVPLIMIIIGAIFRKKAPKKINYLLGYRTYRSMKSQEAWEFSNKYCGNLFFYVGIILAVITVIIMLLVINKSEVIIENVTLIVTLSQLVPLIFCIVPVEMALKKNFDENGNKK